jgi:hypothetical protein
MAFMNSCEIRFYSCVHKISGLSKRRFSFIESCCQEPIVVNSKSPARLLQEFVSSVRPLDTKVSIFALKVHLPDIKIALPRFKEQTNQASSIYGRRLQAQ